MDSLLSTANWPFYNRYGTALANPTEWTEGYLALPISTEEFEVSKEATQLTRNGVALPLQTRKVGGSFKVVAEWPLSGPGYYHLYLIVKGEERLKKTIKILPSKITEAAFEQMLTALETDLPYSVVMSLQKTGALGGLRFEPPSDSTAAQELKRLETAIFDTPTRPGLVKILQELAEKYHQSLRQRELWVRADQARRPHPSRLVLAYSRPGNLVRSGTNWYPLEVMDTRVEQTPNNLENRLVKFFYQQVKERLGWLNKYLEEKQSNSGAIKQLETLKTALGKARHAASFLDEVDTTPVNPDQLTMVLMRQPLYLAALQGFIQFRNSARVVLDEASLSTPLDELPHLYQLWCALTVIKVTLEVAEEYGYSTGQMGLFQAGKGGYFVQVNGATVVTLNHQATGITARLVHERSFGTGDPWLRSITNEQRPDIVLELQRNGKYEKLLIFDPKYKLDSYGKDSSDSSSQKDDIDKMHAYRDAIRDENNKRIVSFAAILYPGDALEIFPSNGIADISRADIAAIPAKPDEPEKFQETIGEVLRTALNPARYV